MRFFSGFISLLFLLLACCTEKGKAEKDKKLSLCDRGVDSLLQSSDAKVNIINISGYGYVDGHCLDSGKSLLLYQEKGFQLLEYGNFREGYYAVDSVVLPLFKFKTFKDRQQIARQDLWTGLSWDESSRLSDLSRLLTSIQPYKDKIYGIGPFNVVLLIDTQEKSYEILMRYQLLEPGSTCGLARTTYFDLMRMKNDTLVATYRDSSLKDTLLVTLDGNHIAPKLRNDLCLGVWLKNGKEGYVGANCPIKGYKRKPSPKIDKPSIPENRKPLYEAKNSIYSDSAFLYNTCVSVTSPDFEEEWLMDVAPDAVLGGKR